MREGGGLKEQHKELPFGEQEDEEQGKGKKDRTREKRKEKKEIIKGGGKDERKGDRLCVMRREVRN